MDRFLSHFVRRFAMGQANFIWNQNEEVVRGLASSHSMSALVHWLDLNDLTLFIA